MASAKLKTTFNTAAVLYEDIRPGYPAELIQEVIDLSGLNDSSRILEIGCGTGKATRPFAERGYELVCLDIGADLIAVANVSTHGHKHIHLSNTSGSLAPIRITSSCRTRIEVYCLKESSISLRRSMTGR